MHFYLLFILFILGLVLTMKLQLVLETHKPSRYIL